MCIARPVSPSADLRHGQRPGEGADCPSPRLVSTKAPAFHIMSKERAPIPSVGLLTCPFRGARPGEELWLMMLCSGLFVAIISFAGVSTGTAPLNVRLVSSVWFPAT
jgi:hypothetical protein